MWRILFRAETFKAHERNSWGISCWSYTPRTQVQVPIGSYQVMARSFFALLRTLIMLDWPWAWSWSWTWPWPWPGPTPTLVPRIWPLMLPWLHDCKYSQENSQPSSEKLLPRWQAGRVVKFLVAPHRGTTLEIVVSVSVSVSVSVTI